MQPVLQSLVETAKFYGRELELCAHNPDLAGIAFDLFQATTTGHPSKEQVVDGKISARAVEGLRLSQSGLRSIDSDRSFLHILVKSKGNDCVEEN